MERDRQLTVLQAKFSAYLSWSQPFLHALISGLDPHVRNVILCNRTENLDRFPVEHVERLPTRYLVKPRLGVLSASYLRRAWQPDLMHAHFGWSGLRLLLLKQILRVPLVVSFGGRDVGLQMRLPDFDALYASMLAGTDAMICVSKDLKQKLVDNGVDPDRIHVIYRGADLDRFDFVDRRERPEGAPTRILMVGRIVEKKGHRYALEALEPLVTEGKRVELRIVGEGEGYHELRRMRRKLGLSSHVQIVGATDHHGVRRHMEEADLLLHCSVTPESGDTEGIPNVVVEAQARGLPVVGTRHGGIGEAVVDGETGLLVPERAVPPLTEALRRFVEQRDDRLAFGRRARAHVEENFNLKRQIERHLAIYEKVVADTATDPEWKTRTWLPADYQELVDRTLLAQNIRHPTEFSIAELMERLVWARRFEARVSGADLAAVADGSQRREFLPEARQLGTGRGEDQAPSERGFVRAVFRLVGHSMRRLVRPRPDGDEVSVESTLEQFYNLKGHVPQWLKFPMKIGLGRILVWAIERRQRLSQGEGFDLEELDRRVFDFFRSGGDLGTFEDTAWDEVFPPQDRAPQTEYHPTESP